MLATWSPGLAAQSSMCRSKRHRQGRSFAAPSPHLPYPPPCETHLDHHAINGASMPLRRRIQAQAIHDHGKKRRSGRLEGRRWHLERVATYRSSGGRYMTDKPGTFCLSSKGEGTESAHLSHKWVGLRLDVVALRQEQKGTREASCPQGGAIDILAKIAVTLFFFLSRWLTNSVGSTSTGASKSVWPSTYLGTVYEGAAHLTSRAAGN